VIFIQGPGHDPEVLKTYSAVEVALYDLLGKQLGAPISELVGGRVRDRIRLYGSAGMYQPPEAYAAEAAGIASLGFRAYKMRPALGPDDDLRTVKLMRDAVGPNVDLMVDAHSWWRMGDRSYAPETIEKLAEQMAEYDIAWLEEPLPPDDHAAYRKLKASGIVPVASGEHESSEESFRDLIGDCVDYVQMDIVCQGGYPTCRRILGDVERSNLAFAFHSWGTDLEVLAAAHLGICWPETVTQWLEYPVYSTARLKTMYPFPLATEILSEPLDIQEGGELIVPTKPGLGIDVNEDVISKYPWIPGPWSFFQLISPPETFAVTADHSLKWAGDSLPSTPVKP
jgi:L-alanine-DL-glutamate epimerase-like enolase superfamily enzyme